MKKLIIAALVALGGCHTCDAPPVVEPTGREVTVFVHGIKGSFLVDEKGERAWLNASDLLSSGDRSLALPPGGPDRFGPLRPDGPLTRFTVFPLIATADVYLPWLEFGAEHLPGFVPFAYDWRLDAADAVKKLSVRIDELAAKRGGDLRVNLVGHSLGGLIALTYVRYGGGDPAKGITWAGARYVKRLALVGAPFGGSPSFLQDILRGDKNGRNARLLSAEAMASFVSAYELLPPGPLHEAKTWESVPSGRRPTAEMLSLARAFRSGLSDGADAPEPPADLSVLVVAGTGRPTTREASIDELDGPTTDGDGRVPADSCLPPKPLDYKVHKTTADHVNLLNDEGVQDAIRASIAR